MTSENKSEKESWGCENFMLCIAATMWLALGFGSLTLTLKEIQDDVAQIKDEVHTLFRLQQEQRAREMK